MRFRGEVGAADAVCPGLALERDRGGTPGVGGASRVLAIIRSEDLVVLVCRSAGALWPKDTCALGEAGAVGEADAVGAADAVDAADAVCPGLALERDRGGTPGVGGASRVLAIIRS